MAAPATDINRSWGSGYGVMLLNRLATEFYENKD
jgi:leucyl aminopeptidase